MATATTRRIRLDLLLVERGLAESRARAQAMVLAGQVRVGEGDARPGRPQGGRPGRQRRPGRGRRRVALGQPGRAQAARGARRLRDRRRRPGRRRRRRLDGRLHRRPARPRRRPRLRDRRRLRAARRPAAPRPAGRVDGARQRPDARRRTTLPEPVDLAVVDVSFISLGLVLGPDPLGAARRRGPIVALVKPQFEAGRAEAKGGVVRDPAVHRRVIARGRGARRPSSASGRGRSSRRRSRARRATASSSSTSRPARRAPSSTS